MKICPGQLWHFRDSEGSRNATMSRFAGRVIKKYGDTEKAYQVFLEEAANVCRLWTMRNFPPSGILRSVFTQNSPSRTDM